MPYIYIHELSGWPKLIWDGDSLASPLASVRHREGRLLGKMEALKTERDRAIEKLAQLIEKIQIAMLTTVTDDGRLWSRAITTQQAKFDGDLWLLSKLDSPKIQEVRHYRQVSLSYVKPDENIHVSLSGTAQIVTDRANAEKLWNPSYEGWLPGGPADPNLALIRVTVERAEYWDAPKLSWHLLAGFIVLSPDRLHDPDYHARITLDKSGGEGS